MDLTWLHRKWFQAANEDWVELYHQKMIGFENFSKQYHTRNVEDIESTARILLPFQVQNHATDQYNLGCSNSTTRIICVEICGHGELYHIVCCDSAFKIYWLKLSVRLSFYPSFFVSCLISDRLHGAGSSARSLQFWRRLIPALLLWVWPLQIENSN